MGERAVQHARGAEGGQHSEVGREPGGEQGRALRRLPRRELALELAVDRPGADDQTGGTRAGAIAVEGGVGGSDHDRMLTETEVVIAGEADDLGGSIDPDAVFPQPLDEKPLVLILRENQHVGIRAHSGADIA